MKILIVTSSYMPEIGGVSRFCVELKKYLEKENDVHLCCRVDHDGGEKIHNVFVSRKECKSSLIYAIINIKRLAKLINRLKPDVVISSGYYPWGFVCSLIRRLKKFRHICYLHGSEIFNCPVYLKGLCNRGIDVLVYNSSFCKDVCIKNGVRAKKDAVVNPVFPTEYFFSKKREGIKREKMPVKFLTIGTLSKRKNQLECAKEIIRHDSVYYVIGKGELEKDLSRLGNKVVLLGQMDEGKDKFLRDANVFIMFPKILKKSFESFGIVYLEALLYGLPVIASRYSGAADLKKYFGSQIVIADNVRDGVKMGMRLAGKRFEVDCEDYFDSIRKGWDEVLNL